MDIDRIKQDIIRQMECIKNDESLTQEQKESGVISLASQLGKVLIERAREQKAAN